MAHQDLTHLKPGDKLAIKTSQALSHIPRITYDMLTVARTTATQAVASYDHRARPHEVRIRLSDGYVIGESYTQAIESTPEIQAQNCAEIALLKRWRAARDATETLIDKPLHQLALTTEQLERLAAAWAEIKAMGASS